MEASPFISTLNAWTPRLLSVLRIVAGFSS